jgi:hypothetical protein
LETILVAALNRKPVSVPANVGLEAEISTEHYSPPVGQIFAVLGISQAELNGPTVRVSVAGLRYLISEIAKQLTVDEQWYLERYPDVQAAVLAGDVPSARVHFQEAGFLEGRLPRPLSFDPDFYYEKYSDLTGAFQKDDAEGLRRHFETRGYFEGRAGVAMHFVEAERWRLASNDLG